MPLVLTPQVWTPPALTAVKVPAGGVAWPCRWAPAGERAVRPHPAGIGIPASTLPATAPEGAAATATPLPAGAATACPPAANANVSSESAAMQPKTEHLDHCTPLLLMVPGRGAALSSCWARRVQTTKVSDVRAPPGVERPASNATLWCSLQGTRVCDTCLRTVGAEGG